MKRVLIIGGTGLLGAKAAELFIEKGYKVRSLSINVFEDNLDFPKEMEIVKGNYLELSDEEIIDLMKDCEGFVFASGIDERISVKPSAYDNFSNYNNVPLIRYLKLAKKCNLKKAVICGSYFTYLNKLWPSRNLTKYHPYIRSRVDQERLALNEATKSFDVSILELPYIFGIQKGRKPVWIFLVKMVKMMPFYTYYPKGGTAMVTTRQVGQAILGAYSSIGSKSYPIGWYNLTYNELFKIIHKGLGKPNRKIINIPPWLFKISGLIINIKNKLINIEGGLDIYRFTEVMCDYAYIDKGISESLGVTNDNLEQAIIDSVKLSDKVIKGKVKTVSMVNIKKEG